MGRLVTTTKQAERRKYRVRSRIVGTAKRPRLSINVSNKHIIAQLIDDTNSKTLVYVTSKHGNVDKKSMTEKAAWVGGQIATKAKQAKLKQATLDRGSKRYHGRVKTIADTAREKGLEI